MSINKKPSIIVVGGGAAGFFAAIAAAENQAYEVVLLEKSTKLLSKVKISGGGRCNVTHHTFDIKYLLSHYPRGAHFLKKVFQQFGVAETIAWFEQRGVVLKAEKDGRMFPTTDQSQTIIDCLMKEARKLNILIHTQVSIEQILPTEAGNFILLDNQQRKWQCQKLIIATGGSPKTGGLDWLRSLGIGVIAPVPSLFSFNMPKNPILSLQGCAVPKAKVVLWDTKQQTEGALLVTHWGMSGPAVLKLSAWAARELAALSYQAKIRVNWLALSEENLREQLQNYKQQIAQRTLGGKNPFLLPERLWLFLLQKYQLNEAKKWADISKKEMHQCVEALCYDAYLVEGKTTFKEEFVTAGGVDVGEVQAKDMQAKRIRNLYFAGEILDIDGVTGGFNFQAAWSTGYVAGKSAADIE
ncbi:MAG: NAD(P)/FAD-dependent oxidoreductase [Cytophagales bacterium]|nr:MAG: NAD(P)/FAD-dependent oxidoreductase [Cytophagales bacterium]